MCIKLDVFLRSWIVWQILASPPERSQNRCFRAENVHKSKWRITLCIKDDHTISHTLRSAITFFISSFQPFQIRSNSINFNQVNYNYNCTQVRQRAKEKRVSHSYKMNKVSCREKDRSVWHTYAGFKHIRLFSTRETEIYSQGCFQDVIKIFGKWGY